jgi:DNA invertase Pin-like site-specific DNA recombinase
LSRRGVHPDGSKPSHRKREEETKITTATDTIKAAIPVVVYASKSSKDEKDAIPFQIRSIEADVEGERDGERFYYAKPFHEEKKSGWRGDRGPELEAALVAAERAAEKHGTAELWVWKSERLARGSGKKAEARSLLEVFARCKRAGVTLRSVRDDECVRDEAYIGMASKLANKYSEDLSGAVKDGKQRQRERGEDLGGHAPDGYTFVTEDKKRTYYRDPEREACIERLLRLGLEDVPPLTAARTMNAEGYRTTKGHGWDRRAVEEKWSNAFYAGAVVYGRGTPEEVVNWNPTPPHPAYIDRAEYELIEAAMKRRRAINAAAHGDRAKGRPPVNHMLSRLIPCPKCGRTMRCITSTYVRKSDGGRSRKYRCDEVVRETGLCDMPPIPAEPLELLVAEGLRGYILNFDDWVASVTERQGVNREGLERERDRQLAELAKVKRLEGKISDDYAAAIDKGDEARADLAVATLQRQREAREQLEASIGDLEATIAESPDAAPVDAMLDFWNGLRRGISTALDTENVTTVNDALRDRFVAFHIGVSADGGEIEVTPELPAETPAVVVWDSPEGRPEADTPEAWAAFYRDNPPTTAKLVTYENGGNAAPFPVRAALSESAATPR